jgi:hypothetical protein
MISAFDVFKIIMGIIISVFILFLILRFAGSYTEIGESSRYASVMINFKKAVSDVYTTGITSVFETKESKLILSYKPPRIETKVAFVDVEPIPLLLSPGEKLDLSRGEYDVSWWKFYFVEALPETNILFIPLENDEKIFSIISNITYFLPSTENLNIKMKIGIGCNGSDYWFGWERQKFLTYVLPYMKTLDLKLNMCENLDYFESKGFKVLVITEDETKVLNASFIVKPVDENMGYVFVKGEEGYDKFFYKNGIDIVALLVGDKELYDYINQKFFAEMEVAMDIMTREINTLSNEPSLRNKCEKKYSEFLSALDNLKLLKADVEMGKEKSIGDFTYQMQEVKKLYEELSAWGCV